MSIYRRTSQTKASNLFLQQCGHDLVKVASENSSLHTEVEKLQEKVASLQEEIEAYQQAATLVAKGRLDPANISTKVSTILKRPIELSSGTTSRSAFSKVSSVKSMNQGSPDRDRDDVRRINNALRTLHI